jgi:hypothetical protein
MTTAQGTRNRNRFVQGEVTSDVASFGGCAGEQPDSMEEGESDMEAYRQRGREGLVLRNLACDAVAHVAFRHHAAVS